MDRHPWTPQRLLEFSGSYWGICAIHAALKLNLFTLLAERQGSATELARRSGCNLRGLEMLLNALTAMELLEKSGKTFSNSPFAAQRLSRTSPDFMGHILLHHHYLMSGWAHLDQAVRTGEPVRGSSSHVSNEAERESFLLGMFNMASMLAPLMAQKIDLSGCKDLLDFGGGPGTYAIHFCLANPGLRSVIFDLPTTRPFAEQTLARFPVEGRVAFQSGSFHEDSPQGSFDVVWLSHILHGEGVAACRTIIGKAVEALAPGGLLLIHEFVLDDARSGPLFPALFSLNMLIGTAEGQSYSFGELSELIADAGGKDIRRLNLDLPGPSSVIAATF